MDFDEVRMSPGFTNLEYEGWSLRDLTAKWTYSTLRGHPENFC